MFLRSLTLRGFKSFADKTTLEFTPGISVIVGPNGSGKSNIADGIAWVLGEQGPRALRGGQMTDVIFAGTPARPALGMAEVRMVIDNAAGLIPVPASEIEISRLVYRSGESEYRLGGRPCRLLDIQELLSDTGVGRSLHTIVGQGQLDAILGARPEERRLFVEEAAGIAKHRRRRERAERKLAGLEQDLLRLQDLASELRRQLKPLKQQAELAERHDALTREADDLARKLAAARLRELYRDREVRRPSWQEGEDRQSEAQARLADLDREIARLDAEREGSERDERDGEARRAAALERKSKGEQVLRDAIRGEAEARERLATSSGRSGRLFSLEGELARTEKAAEETRSTLARRTAELEEAESGFRRAQAGRRDGEEERRRMGELAAGRRAEGEALARALAGHESELAGLRATIADLAARRAATQKRAEELRADVERLDAVSTPLARELESLGREQAEFTVQLADLDAEEKGLLARREVAEARRAELSESAGAAFLKRRGHRSIGLLRDLIQAPPDLWPALRAALGPFADAVVYAGWREAMDAVAHAPSGVTLAVEPGSEAVRGVAGDSGLLASVRPDPRVKSLVASLLGDCVLVHNVAEAEARHRSQPAGRFVTPDGTIVGPSFVQTSPGPDERLEEVRRLAAAIDRELAAVHRGRREARARLDQVTERADEVTRRLEEADLAISAAADAMAAASAEMAMLSRESDMVVERESAVGAAASMARAGLAALPAVPDELPSLPPVPEPPMTLRVEVEALRRDQERLASGAERIRRELASLREEDPIALRGSLQSAESNRLAAEEGLQAAETELLAASAAHGEASERARRVRDLHARAVASWRDQAGLVERLRSDHEEEDRLRYDLDRRIAEAERILSQGHGADPAAAVAELSPEETSEELARRSELVARRLGLLGRVNLLATGELESVQQRHDFLVRELEDVKAARRDLEHLIEDIDRRVAEQFETAFADVAREFANLFMMMFPGGEGRLTLTDPGDPLGTGIEVEARPGRGRVKRLSLLSGGERSLAALAFLFAIFRARPSPFYLMDEVEAALDDVNLHRFLEVVRELARDSQILVVTHQKRTMEIADALYGVSMGQGGATTVISQRLAEAAAR